MNNKLIEALEAERSKSQNYQSSNTSGNKPEIKKDKALKTPHLAVTHTDQGGAASGRNHPLLLKSKNVQNKDFEFFMKCMNNESFLLALFNNISSDPEILTCFIDKGKEYEISY